MRSVLCFWSHQVLDRAPECFGQTTRHTWRTAFAGLNAADIHARRASSLGQFPLCPTAPYPAIRQPRQGDERPRHVPLDCIDGSRCDSAPRARRLVVCSGSTAHRCFLWSECKLIAMATPSDGYSISNLVPAP